MPIQPGFQNIDTQSISYLLQKGIFAPCEANHQICFGKGGVCFKIKQSFRSLTEMVRYHEFESGSHQND